MLFIAVRKPSSTVLPQANAHSLHDECTYVDAFFSAHPLSSAAISLTVFCSHRHRLFVFVFFYCLIEQDANDFAVSRRWDEDVVFKNCAKKDEADGGFVNDTLRSAFHRRFMDKYVIHEPAYLYIPMWL